MRYASVEGFASYVGDLEFYRLSQKCECNNIEGHLEDCEVRMLAYIVPNTPRCDVQHEAFAKAVYAQFAFEQSEANAQIQQMPNGMKSFTVNGFSATLGAADGMGVSNVGICRTAYAYLLEAGLLYKGVGCGC